MGADARAVARMHQRAKRRNPHSVAALFKQQRPDRSVRVALRGVGRRLGRGGNLGLLRTDLDEVGAGGAEGLRRLGLAHPDDRRPVFPQAQRQMGEIAIRSTPADTGFAKLGGMSNSVVKLDRKAPKAND